MNINICGRREEGKSTLALYLAQKRHRGIVVFDPRGMFKGHVVWSGDDLQEAIDERVWQDGQPIVFRSDAGNSPEMFKEMCAVIFPPRFRYGGFAVIVDEASELQTANSINEDLKRVVKQHPTRPPEHAVTIIQTTHRLADWNGSSKALMDELYIFATTSPRDIIAVEDHCGPDVAAVVPHLPKHQCVRYLYSRQDDGKPQFEIWNQPEVWHVDFEEGAGGAPPPEQKANLKPLTPSLEEVYRGRPSSTIQ